MRFSFYEIETNHQKELGRATKSGKEDYGKGTKGS